MTLDEVIQKQADLGLGDVHLVYLDEHRWYCAHLDSERAQGQDVMDACKLNQWLGEHAAPTEPVGHFYVAHPAYWGEWELIHLGECCDDNVGR